MQIINQKKKSETGVKSAPGFPRMEQVHYFDRLAELHDLIQPKAYLEIGSETGASLSLVTCEAVAIDPVFQLRPGATHGKSVIHLFQQASDDAFADPAFRRLGLIYDLAFLDGMHLFEYLLRDFIRTERNMAAAGVIAMHDCVPFNPLVAERDWDKSKTMSWTGDVWKLIPILKEWRPDLDIQVGAYAPTGLVEIRNLDPGSTVLERAYTEICDRYMAMSLQDYGVHNFCRLCDLPAVADLAGLAQDMRLLVIKTCTPDAATKPDFGDHHFAVGLARGFEQLGWRTRIDARDAWAIPPEPSQLDLVLRGHGFYAPHAGTTCLMWYIYPGKPPVTPQELDSMAHVFASSRLVAQRLATNRGAGRFSFLPQAVDPEVMYPPEAAAQRSGIVFVANNHFGHGQMRPMAALASETGTDLQIWGYKWEDTPVASAVMATSLANNKVGATYRAAAIVLCDHNRLMAQKGYLSNRVYDALACGAAVICDPVQDMPDEFRPYVTCVATADEFAAAVQKISAETPAFKDQRRRFALEVMENHSFVARARLMMDVAGLVPN
ncbi:MAG: glycosyltransferase [Loktanella sp.]|nr:glycosyltransferase [Loktanella sp.]